MQCVYGIAVGKSTVVRVTEDDRYRRVRYQSIRASVDALCRDEQGQISRDPRTKRFLTQRESLAKPSKYASNSAFAHL